jgi:hypothetical protein
MGRIDIILPDELEKRFREEIFKKYGMKKGNITMAVEEAVQDWVKKKKKLEEE